MKKILSMLLAVALLFTVLPTEVFQLRTEAATVGDLTYTIENGKVTITECRSSASGKLVIPDTIAGYPVTSIGDEAFYYCSSLTSIIIPDSVTRIGDSAFYNCDSLTSITISDSVTSIGNYAFTFCDSLTSITIPDSVTSIGDSAFSSCYSLTSITIPDSVTSIGKYAFCWCDSLTSVTIGNSVTSIDYCAFSRCDSLTSVTIGNSVTSIDYCAFSSCDSLTSITIPDSVTSIGDSAFEDCFSLTSITIPGSVTSIGEYAFSSCDSLTSITIPDSVTSIGEYAFLDCNSLTNITIPDSVTSIGMYAFSNCASLISVTIGNSVTSTGYYTFSNCDSLTRVTVGNGVTSIGNSTFYGCDSLTSITIPDSVTSIREGAFRYCDGLADVYYRGTEEECAAMSIGSSNDDLVNATWHYNACIGTATHTYDNACDTVCNVCGEQRTIVHTYDDACDPVCSVCGFERIDIHAYDDDSDPMCEVCGLVRYLSYEVVEGEVIITGCDSNFVGDLAIPSFIDGYPVTRIGDATFAWCEGLTSVTIPNGVTAIGSYAFGDCSNLTSVSIPDTVISIGDSAFWYCWNLDKVILPNGMTAIEAETFFGCNSLTNITFSGNVTSIGDGAFGDCSALTDIWFCGTFEQWMQLVNSVNPEGNEALFVASLAGTVHYDTCVTEHNYDGDCDEACNACDWVREATAPHTYTSNCDVNCNVCGSLNETAEAHHYVGECDDTCEACGFVREVAVEHTYDHACDTTCNLCAAVREITHTYDGDCDATCNVCNKTRTVTKEHTYDNACDTTCNVCGNTRSITHTYDGVCDGVCNVCGYTRIPEMHKVSVDLFAVQNDTSNPFKVQGGVYTSTNKAHSSSATMMLTAIANGSADIDYYTSTESGYDKLIIKHNGATVVTVSGSTSWQTKTIAVSVGDTITITYQKDGSVSNGNDEVYVKFSASASAEEVDPTCTDAVVCDVCGITVKEALGHTYSSDCDTTCNVCDDAREAAVEHTLGEWVVDRQPTATENGLRHKECSVCGDVVSEEITTKIIQSSATLELKDAVFVKILYTLEGVDFEQIDITKDAGMLCYTKEEFAALNGNIVFDESRACVGLAKYSANRPYYYAKSDAFYTRDLANEYYYVGYVKLPDGTYLFSQEKLYGPTVYAYNQINKTSGVSEAFKTVCIALINYTAAAQKQFAGITDDGLLANKDLTDAQKSLVWSDDVSNFNLAPEVPADKQVTADKTVFKAAQKTLRLQEKISLIAVYSIKKTVVESAVECGTIFWTAEQFAALNGAPSLDNIGGGQIVAGLEAYNSSGSQWSSEAPGVAAKDLADTSYYFLGYVKHADGSVSYSGVVSYSFEQYIYNQAIKTTTDAKLLEFVKRLYVYERAAKVALK